MKEPRADIAARLKELRELRGKSPDDLAQALGITTDEYVEYEAGQKDIPASTLQSAARLLDADLTELLTGEAPRMKVFAVTRAGWRV